MILFWLKCGPVWTGPVPQQNLWPPAPPCSPAGRKRLWDLQRPADHRPRGVESRGDAAPLPGTLLLLKGALQPKLDRDAGWEHAEDFRFFFISLVRSGGRDQLGNLVWCSWTVTAGNSIKQEIMLLLSVLGSSPEPPGSSRRFWSHEQ